MRSQSLFQSGQPMKMVARKLRSLTNCLLSTSEILKSGGVSLPKRVFAAAALSAVLPVFAQTPVETASREHIFPVFMDGGGLRSHLFASNLADTPNACALMLAGESLSGTRIQANEALTISGARVDFELAAEASLTVASTGASAFLSNGWAKLVCAEPVTAHLLLTSEDDGTLVGMAAMESSPPAANFQMPVLPRLGSLTLAVANDSDGDAACAIELEDQDGASVGAGSITVGAGDNLTAVLSEHVDIPEDFAGGAAAVSCDREVAAAGLALNAATFTALPAVALDADGSGYSSHILPLVVDGDGFLSQLLVTSLAQQANSCRLGLRGSGLDGGRFSFGGNAMPTGNGATLDFPRAGAQLALLSNGGSDLVFGYATLDCDGPAAAANLLSVGAAESSYGMAAIPGVLAADSFRFPVIPGTGRLALLFSNPEDSSADCAVGLRENGGAPVAGNTVSVPVAANSTAVRFFADLFDAGSIPPDFDSGAVDVDCAGVVSAVAVPLGGTVFAAMPPAVFSVPVRPAFSSDAAVAELLLIPNEAMTPLDLPAAEVEVGGIVYSLTPDVPGLSFDAVNRRLSGTPTENGQYRLSYSATGDDGLADSFEFTIHVSDDFLDSSGCSDGRFVDDAANKPGLVGDCRALVAFANNFIKTGLLPEDNVLRQWGREAQENFSTWDGVTLYANRVWRISLVSRGLKGGISPELGKLTNLQYLFLSKNELSGSIPPELGELTNLQSLELSNNQLSGPIPPEMGGLTNLQSLQLVNNQLSGPIPPEMGGLTNLRLLFLSNNQLSGPIPPEMGGLTNLQFLFLENNRLSGSIPPEMGGLTNLRFLFLSKNQLSGSIPPELGKLTNLETLAIEGNQLIGGLPESLRELCFGGDPSEALCLMDFIVRHSSVDSDSDGVADYHDAFPMDPDRSADFDGDGISDDLDPLPRDSAIGDLTIFKDTLVTMPVDEQLTTEVLHMDEYSREFYKYFEDELDFLIVMSNIENIYENQVTTYFGRAYSVRNEISGVGRSNFYSNSFGSRETLKTLIHFPYLYGLWGGPGLHEILHTWANFVLPTSEGGHWGFSSVNGQLGGFDPTELKILSNGRYSAGSFGTFANGGNGVPYSELELYLAGFISADDVPDIQYFEDGKWDRPPETDADGNYIFTGTLQTMTIEDLIALYGEREPAWTESQKNFRAAAILIYNEDDQPTYEQMFTVSDHVEKFSKPESDSSNLYNFYEATGGKGSINMSRLSDLLLKHPTASESTSSSLPDSYGDPEQPLHSHAH